MSFLHSSKPVNDLLYAVGGFKATGRVMSFEGSPIDMHNEFLCIPLSSSEEEDGGGRYDGQKAKVLRETSMKKGKLFPLIVEIGHCIYVLSMAPYPVEEFPVEFPVESAFEVYNLEEEASGWKSLPAPPFIGARGYRAPCNRVHRYSYLVVDDQKLFVSDGISSCVFDTWTRVWEKCDLFSECFPNIKQPLIKRHWSHIAPPDCCGPGFPFKNQPILWKDNIFLCFIPADAQNPPIAAFHIISDYSRAVQMPLRFDCLFNWYWPVDHLVHLGGDYIAVVVREDEYQDCLTILTFKLSKVDGGIVSCQLKSERHCRGFISNYCFAL